jgi:Ni,Fe-hydrogenase I cytochrome b subunit
VKRFHARHRIAFWLIVVAVVVAVWVVFFFSGHGTVSGGSS